MTRYKRGDVVLVQFPFTTAAGGKQRPAIVISGEHYNRGSPDVITASITSTLNALSHVGDHRLTNWKTAGLLEPSLAQTKSATVKQSMITRNLGNLSADDWMAFARGLRLALDFP